MLEQPIKEHQIHWSSFSSCFPWQWRIYLIWQPLERHDNFKLNSRMYCLPNSWPLENITQQAIYQWKHSSRGDLALKFTSFIPVLPEISHTYPNYRPRSLSTCQLLTVKWTIPIAPLRVCLSIYRKLPGTDTENQNTRKYKERVGSVPVGTSIVDCITLPISKNLATPPSKNHAMKSLVTQPWVEQKPLSLEQLVT